MPTMPKPKFPRRSQYLHDKIINVIIFLCASESQKQKPAQDSDRLKVIYDAQHTVVRFT